MRTIRTKVYKFSELSESAKEKAIEWHLNTDNGDYSFAWDNVKEDAKEIGLNIIELSDHRENKGEFVNDAQYTAEKIISEHGNTCQTYKTASQFIHDRERLDIDEQDEELEELEVQFLHDILEDYRIMYNNDIEYQNSEEYAIESITANEYEFKADGTRF